MFNPEPVINQLQVNVLIFENLLKPSSSIAYLYKPAPDKWCMLEIAGHLLDEERDDFRARLSHILNQVKEPMPFIDPPAWVTEHQYLDQVYETQVNRFLEERTKSINWLQTQIQSDWGLVYLHPKLGLMSAGMLLSNWLAHDYLHIRQILQVKHAWLQQYSGESLDYAGIW